MCLPQQHAIKGNLSATASVKVLLVFVLLIAALCFGMYVGMMSAQRHHEVTTKPSIGVAKRKASPTFVVEKHHKEAFDQEHETTKEVPKAKATPRRETVVESGAELKRENLGSLLLSHKRQLDTLKPHLPIFLRRALDGERIERPLWELELSHLHVKVPSVALTLDAHFEDKYVPKILSVLKRYNVRVTFFLTGHWVDSFPDSLRAIASDGHELGNHTYSHPKLSSLPDDSIIEEVKRTEQAMLRVLNDATPITPYVRPPYGDRDERVVHLLLSAGYIPTYWAVDSLDWKKGISGDEVVSRVLNKASSGDIILMHASSGITAEVLPRVIEGLFQKGFEVCSLSELIMRSVE
jgi:peptidoglycan/xylan/chitin deacetylase (PgdA/CDA1 family)